MGRSRLAADSRDAGLRIRLRVSGDLANVPWEYLYDDEHGFVRVTVADTGPGVEDEVADDLFRAFNSTKASGMGLGLSICRTIVEASGGRIWMEPHDGGGALFHFTLVKAGGEEEND